jgi:hypothetical protein
LDAATKCERDRLKLEAGYHQCRLRVEAKGLRKGGALDFSRCDKTFATGWAKSALRAAAKGATCPGDQDEVRAQSSACADEARDVVGGAPFARCGNGVLESGEECEWGTLGGQTCQGLGYALGGELGCAPAQCRFDVSGCADARVLFVSSERVSGDFGGVAGGDALCRQWAAAAGLSGDFVAWLADASSNPLVVLGVGGGPYALVDGTVVSDELFGATTLEAPPALDENGNAVVGFVWTGTSADGTPTSDNCANWSATVGVGDSGFSAALDAGWTAGGSSPCGVASHLYCVER